MRRLLDGIPWERPLHVAPPPRVQLGTVEPEHSARAERAEVRSARAWASTQVRGTFNSSPACLASRRAKPTFDRARQRAPHRRSAWSARPRRPANALLLRAFRSDALIAVRTELSLRTAARGPRGALFRGTPGGAAALYHRRPPRRSGVGAANPAGAGARSYVPVRASARSNVPPRHAPQSSPDRGADVHPRRLPRRLHRLG